MNQVILVGRLKGAAQPGVGRGGLYFCNFRVECDVPEGRSRGGTFGLVAFDAPLCKSIETFHDGDRVRVQAHLANRKRVGGVGVPDRWELQIYADSIAPADAPAQATGAAPEPNECLDCDIPF